MSSDAIDSQSYQSAVAAVAAVAHKAFLCTAHDKEITS